GVEIEAGRGAGRQRIAGIGNRSAGIRDAHIRRPGEADRSEVERIAARNGRVERVDAVVRMAENRSLSGEAGVCDGVVGKVDEMHTVLADRHDAVFGEYWAARRTA